jgi:hypothetical protein
MSPSGEIARDKLREIRGCMMSAALAPYSESAPLPSSPPYRDFLRSISQNRTHYCQNVSVTCFAPESRFPHSDAGRSLNRSSVLNLSRVSASRKPDLQVPLSRHQQNSMSPRSTAAFQASRNDFRGLCGSPLSHPTSWIAAAWLRTGLSARRRMA